MNESSTLPDGYDPPRSALELAPRKHPVDDPPPTTPHPVAPVDEPKKPEPPVDEPDEEEAPDT